MANKFNTQIFINKSKEIHGEYYNYSLVQYKNCDSKVKIICHKHGEFEQIPYLHYKKGSGCIKCAEEKVGMSFRKNDKDFISESKVVHNNFYDYSLIEYISARKKVKIICPKHGVFEQTPTNHLRGKGCRKCYNERVKSRLIMSTKEFTSRAEIIHDYKFDYSNVDYKGGRTKVKIICPEHGVFEQTPSNHISGKGCLKCGVDKIGKKLNNKKFIDRSELIHDYKFNYSLSEYENTRTKIKIICPIHGEFKQTPQSHLKGKGCRKCSSSKGEKEIRKFLKNKNIKFIEQKSFYGCKNIKNLLFDFYLPDYNTCIEYDGLQHYEPIDYFGGLNGFKKLKINDKIKNNFCKDNGIMLIRIKYDSIILDEMNKFIS